MSNEAQGRGTRKRIGAAYASGVLTGILLTLIGLVGWARLAGPPPTALSASPANAPAVVAPAGNLSVATGTNAPSASAPPPSAAAPTPAPPPSPPAPEEQPAPRSQATSADGKLLLPVAGIPLSSVHDNFNEMRGSVRHEALDIMAPLGTAVVAAGDGVIRKLFESRKGGHTVYQFNADQTLCYYYAHLDRYAGGLAEGQMAHRGEILGYVGASGNADPGAPHLHFAVTRLDADKKWWTGAPIDPYPLLEGVHEGE